MGMMQQPPHWRCFHCGAEFRKKQVKKALLHFGTSPSSVPSCKVTATYVRGMEAELARYRAQAARTPQTFEEAWKGMEDKGYKYGHDALEQVRLGFELGRSA